VKDNFDGLVKHLLDGNIFMEEAIEILERSMIESALTRNSGNQSAASKQLGIHRNTLQRKMIQYDIGSPRAHARRKPVSQTARQRTRKTSAA
jgi:Fis family transcriptional regulator, factor for inversion stimulation protein